MQKSWITVVAFAVTFFTACVPASAQIGPSSDETTAKLGGPVAGSQSVTQPSAHKSSIRSSKKWRASKARTKKAWAQKRRAHKSVIAANAKRKARTAARYARPARVAASSRVATRNAEPRKVATPVSYGYSEGGGSTGIASYYWQGQRVASGGWFNPSAMTAAHKTLPFGTRVRVTHMGNGRSVDVTINDRGPFIRGRIIDLSKGAAGVIGMTGQGLANVRMTVLGR